MQSLKDLAQCLRLLLFFKNFFYMFAKARTASLISFEVEYIANITNNVTCATVMPY